MNTKLHIASGIRRGFTLVELLTVIAIIGVLAAILFPVVGKVRESAAETSGRAQFSQWGQAFELFRQEFGYYPDLAATAGGSVTLADLYVNRAGDADSPAYNGNRFYEVLTGRIASSSEGTVGARISSTNDGYAAGNTRAASLYTFGENEVEGGGANTVVIRDQSGNADIVVMFDRDQNGTITVGNANADYSFGVGSLPAVRSVRSGERFELQTADFPTTGVRAGVIFYSAGYGNRMLMSWK